MHVTHTAHSPSSMNNQNCHGCTTLVCSVGEPEDYVRVDPHLHPHAGSYAHASAHHAQSAWKTERSAAECMGEMYNLLPSARVRVAPSSVLFCRGAQTHAPWWV